jgi:hypothetical protein
MLRIVVNNQFLDLFPDTSISYTLLSPIFNEIGSYSYPFEIPATTHNKKTFSFPGRLDKFDFQCNQYDVQVFFKGSLFISGSIVAEESGDTIECYITTGNGHFNSAIKDLSMKSVDLGILESLPSGSALYNYLNGAVNSSYPDYPFAMFPLINYLFYSGTAFQYYWDDFPYYNYWDLDNPGFNSSMMLTPFVYIPYFLDKLSQKFGYTIKSSIFHSGELKNLVLYNSLDAIKNPTWDHPFGLVPDFELSGFISGLQSMFGCVFFVNESTREITIRHLKDIIVDSLSIDFSDNIISLKAILEDRTEGYSFEFNPDAGIGNLPDQYKTIEDYMTVKSPVADLGSLPLSGNEVNDIRLVEDQFRYYIYAYNAGSGSNSWQMFGSSTLKAINQKGENPMEVATDLFPIDMQFEPFPTMPGSSNIYGKILVPVTSHKGLTPLYDHLNPLKDKYKPRLMFYRGMFEDDSGNQYPLGSASVYDASHNKITDADISIQWDGEYGLFNNFYKEWFYWKTNNARKVEIKKKMSINELISFDASRKYRIQNKNFLISKIELTLSLDSLSEAKIEAYKA